MHKLPRLLIILALLAGSCASDSGSDEPTPTRTQEGFAPVEDGVLTVATNLPAPGSWNGDDPAAMEGGFEYAIATELAKRLELGGGVKVVNVSFAALVAGQAQNFDIALSQVTITDERAEVVDFTVPYFSSDQGVMVRKGTKV